jgi:methylmalonyl-CoA/ethylmalonyl-CoA epimerase
MASTYKPAVEMAKSGPTLLRGAKLHHIGFAVRSISRTAEGFAASIGASWNGEVIHDPLQQVRVTFMSRDVSGPLIELVEPAEVKSPISKFVSSGGGLHHFCYEVNSLDDELRLARSVGGLIVKRPLPAVAFGGRQIAWVFTRQKLLLEYLEAATGSTEGNRAD